MPTQTRKSVHAKLLIFPYIIVLTLPVASLLASLLSVGSLARHNELVAMKSSGVSLYRILAPLLVVGVLLSLIVVFVGGWTIPVLNAKLRVIENYQIKRKPSREDEPQRNLVYQDQGGIAYHVAVLRGTDVDQPRNLAKSVTVE